MKKSTTYVAESKAIMDRVEITSDTLASRAGLSLFVRYLRGIEIFPQLETFFGSIRCSRKGQQISEIFKQLFCFFLEGTSGIWCILMPWPGLNPPSWQSR